MSKGSSVPTRRRELCLLCDKELFHHSSLLHYLTSCDKICLDCRSGFKKLRQTRMLEDLSVYVLYDYNESFQRCILQYKECCDEALAPVFLAEFKGELRRKYRGSILIPMPSSFEKRQERGFDHVRKMFECLRLPIVDCFYKSEDFDQKAQNKAKRSHIRDILKLNENIRFLQKRVVLIDDVCTTGSTLRAAYDLLKKQDLEISALVAASRAEFVGKRR